MFRPIYFYLLFLITMASCSVMIRPIAGNFSKNPKSMTKEMSPQALEMINKSFEGINLDCLQDIHVHAVGMGKGGTGAWVNPHMLSPRYPWKFLQYQVYMNASGIKNIENADQEYMDRLVELASIDKRYGRLNLLAFDYNYNKNGTKNLQRSTFHIPNEYVYKLSSQYPKLINPIISVHPDRKDAIEELEKYGKRGVKFIKWLPNAMRIDPSDPDYRQYYEIVKKYDMTILSHTGHEKAVDGEEFQKLANPDKFKVPLDMGVKIIMAHVASLGSCQNLSDSDSKEKPCFENFWKLFTNPKYEKNLFAELSGVTIYTRVGNPISKLLEHPEYHHRVVNGSDYPLPAINILYRTSQLKNLGYITAKERTLLNEIYDFNPLLFDFVLKRNLKHPESGKKFLGVAFEIPKELGCKAI